MIVPDINVLIYAYDESIPQHKTFKKWWEEVISGDEPVGIPSVVLLAFVRLVTHPTVVRNPLAIEQAQEIVKSWFADDHVLLLSPSQSTIDAFFSLLCETGVAGNLCTDAIIAALAIEYGATVYSSDRDFGRFPKLSWINPAN